MTADLTTLFAWGLALACLPAVAALVILLVWAICKAIRCAKVDDQAGGDRIGPLGVE